MKMLSTIGLLLAATAGALQAQDAAWPNGPITIIVPYGTGGGTDSTARALAASLSKKLDVPFVVENRPGAGGALALGHFLNSVEPNGQTLLVSQTGVLTTTPILNEVAYKREDFRAVAHLANAIEVLVASNEYPANTPEEFIDYATANPDQLSMVVSSVGSQGWMGIQQLQGEIGHEIPFVPLPHGGGANQATMVAGNHAQAGVISMTGAAPFLESGQMKAIGILQAQRSALSPELPTFAEAGFDISIGDSIMIYATQETSDEIVSAINTAVSGAYDDPVYLETLSNLMLEASYGDEAVATEVLQEKISLAEEMLGG